jgi:hypothetical protein
MKTSLCLGVVMGLMALGGLSPANATVGGSAIGASRPALAVGTIVQQARWWHCKWYHHRRHCWH